MLLDMRTTFSENKTLVGTASNNWVNYGDQIDLGTDDRAMGLSRLYLNIRCTADILTAGGAGTLQFRLVTDSGGTIATSTGSNAPTQHWISDSYATDGQDANDLHMDDVIVQMQLPIDNYERYMGLQIRRVSQSITAGTVHAFLTREAIDWRAFPEAPGRSV